MCAVDPMYPMLMMLLAGPVGSNRNLMVAFDELIRFSRWKKGVHVHLLFKICSINVSSSQNSKAKYTRNLSPTRLKPALIFSWLRLRALQPKWPTRLKACCGQPILGPGDGYPVILSHQGGCGTGCGHCKTHGKFYGEKHGCSVQQNRLL